jgi:DNA replication protein DnaC
MPVLSKPDEFLARFSLAGGPWVQELTPHLRALRAQDPARFDDLRATYLQRLEAQETEERAEKAAREREVLAAGERERLRARAARLKTAGARLTDEMRDSCISGTYEHWEAVKAAQAWWEARAKPWFVLSGQTGSGKTVAAATLIVEHGGIWMRSDDIVRTFAGYYGDALDRQQAAKQAPLLVLEDVGAELEPARMLPALLELLDERASASETPTIVTTNDTKKTFAARYDNGRLHSRLLERSTWAPLTTQDMRRKNGGRP